MPDPQQIERGSSSVATHHHTSDAPVDLPSFYDDDTDLDGDDLTRAPKPWYRQRRWIALIAAAALVEAHGGEIEAGERVGGGATFSFMLPRTDVTGSGR